MTRLREADTDEERRGYKAISDYGLIGNLETCALVGCDGSIDWCCFPHLESPSVFAAILDDRTGGWFQIRPAGEFRSEIAYLGDTNILDITFTAAEGRVRLTDFMPVRDPLKGEDPSHQTIFRRIRGVSGRVTLNVDFRPRFDYARVRPALEKAPGGVAAKWQNRELYLQAPFSLEPMEGGATGSVEVAAGESVWVVLQYGHRITRYPEHCEAFLDKTRAYWEDWSHSCDEAHCVFQGAHHAHVVRSELALKLLTHHDTGAIAAAATTSLPEHIGGVRNWDYRFAWIRDASFTAQALHSLGHSEEAMDYFQWIKGVRPIAGGNGKPLEFQIMYGLHGELKLEEVELDHLEGYRGSRPVRIGNAAHQQRQMDIYGELLLAFYETTRYGKKITPEDWTFIRGVAAEVEGNWESRDSGIWEVRGGPRHYTYSKLMCWVALDRAVKMAHNTGFEAPAERWAKTRDKIRGAILEQGFDRRCGSFVQSFGGDSLDATSLLIPKMGLLPFRDQRVQGTIRATQERLLDHGMVYRYEGDDGLPGQEGAFLLCTFWLVNALTLSGRIDEAEDLFFSVIGKSSSLGLLSEQVSPENGTYLGNYPQAFSHIGLVNSALYLGRARGRTHRGPTPIGEDSPAA